MNRDQVYLAIGTQSIARTNADYYPLVLAESMLSATLYNLRQQTGMFYTISGELTGGSCEQPGFAYIATIVSQENIDKAKKLMKEFIQKAADLLTIRTTRRSKKSTIKRYSIFLCNKCRNEFNI